MSSIIFYSWQSDLPNRTNRGLIEDALNRSAKKLHSDGEISVEPVIDRDTRGVAGSPDIVHTIFEKIDGCDVFVADVSITNRGKDSKPTPNPNVLIELGYAIKSLSRSRIILIVNTAYGGVNDLPFDLRSNRVLQYNMPEDVSERAPTRKQLESQLLAALSLIYSTSLTTPTDAIHVPTEQDLQWRDAHRAKAQAEVRSAKYVLRTGMEVAAFLSNPRMSVTSRQLRSAAESSQIETFGWPIGIVLPGDAQPKPVNDGIVATILANVAGEDRTSFDYWSLRHDGSFYLLKSLFEDLKSQDYLNFDTRIIRTTEVLLYLNRLYRALGVPDDKVLHVAIRYTGLRNYRLGASEVRRWLRHRGPCVDGEVETSVSVALKDIESQLTDHVNSLVSPLFTLFDFFQVDEKSSLSLSTILRTVEYKILGFPTVQFLYLERPAFSTPRRVWILH